SLISTIEDAIRRNDEGAIQSFLNSSTKLNLMLHIAAENSNERIVQLSLKAGANVNTTGRCYTNALQAAAYGGSEAIVRLMLDAGAHVNGKGGEYGTALQAAAKKGSKDVIKILLDA